MALTATFKADFDQFERSVVSAVGYLKNFDTVTKTSMRSLADEVRKVNGDRLVAEAGKMVSAVQSIGGVSKLTDAEMKRLASTLDQATEKMQRMGQDVPASFVSMREEIRSLTPVTEDVAKSVDKAEFSFGKLVAGLVTAQAIIGTVKSVWSSWTDLIKGSINAFAEQESAQRRMQAALIAQGTVAPQVIKQYNQLASTFQNTTVFADELVMEMQALLVQIGDVMPSQMDGALTAATNLASGLGIDLRTATMLVGKAFEGETGTLKRYGIVIDETKLKTQGVTAVLDAIQQKFGGQAQAEADTYAGKIKQLGNAWGDLKEQLGEFVASNEDTRVLLSALNAIIRDMTNNAGPATTALGKLWDVWSKYIQIGQTITPGVSAFWRWLRDVGTEAEKTEWYLTGLTGAILKMNRAWRATADEMTLKPLDMGQRQMREIEEELTRKAAASILKGEEEIQKKREAAQEAAQKKALASAQELARAQDALFGRDLIAKAADYVRYLGDLSNVSSLAANKKEELRKVVVDALDAYQRLGRVAPQALRDIEAATRPLLVSTRQWAQVELKAAVQQLTPFEASVRNLTTEFVPFRAAVKDSADEIRAATEAALTLGETLQTSLGNVLSNLGTTFSNAFTGGGGLAGAMQSLGVQMADSLITSLNDSLKKKFPETQKNMSAAIGIGSAGAASIGAAFGGTTGATIGGLAGSIGGLTLALSGAVTSTVALGAATMGIGAAAVGVYMLGRHFFGVSKEVKEARKEMDDFQSRLQSTLTEQQRAAAGGQSWAMTLIAVRDAYLAVGKSAAEAERLVGQMLNTNRPDQARAAARQIEEVFQRLGQGQIEATALFTELSRVATLTGERLPEAFLPVIAQLEQMTLLTKEQADALRDLAGEPSWQQMEASAKALGIDLSLLGNAFDSKKLASSAEDMLRHFNTLRAGGMDVGTMLTQTSGQMSELVQRAIALGTELPSGLQEYIQELARAGMLVDENGDALTDLSRLNFAEPLERGINRLIDKFSELIDLILGRLQPALSNITMPELNMPSLPVIPMAQGGAGVVSRPTLFLAGEAGPEHVSFRPVGQAGGETVIHTHVHLDGREVATSVARHMGNRLALAGAR
jgi:hypothetical protein